jgi:hypothetical protein
MDLIFIERKSVPMQRVGLIFKLLSVVYHFFFSSIIAMESFIHPLKRDCGGLDTIVGSFFLQAAFYLAFTPTIRNLFVNV